eukprot:1311629-Pyramimonas_sp.AAC.1
MTLRVDKADSETQDRLGGSSRSVRRCRVHRARIGWSWKGTEKEARSGNMEIIREKQLQRDAQ